MKSIKLWRGLVLLALSFMMFGWLMASGLCNTFGDACTNWTSDVRWTLPYLVSIILFGLLGFSLLLNDFYLNSTISIYRKIGFTLAVLTIVAVPYSLIVTPVLLLLVNKYIR